MEVFFDEFEEYVKNKYGEESYLKTLMEDTLLPLKKSLEKITSKEILESLFGQGNATTELNKAINNLNANISSPSSMAGVKSPTKEQESGLDKLPQRVEIVDINQAVLNKIYNSAGVADKASEEKSKKKSSEDENEGGGFGLLGMLLKGGLLTAGITALMSGFFTDGKWKGALKLASKILLSFSGLESGIKTFFTGIGGGIEKLGEFFGKSKTLKTLGKVTGITGLFKGITSGKGLFKFLGKGLKALAKIPYLGSIISFAFAYDRFKSGDIVGGILEIASGIASAFPIVGTALAIGIDAIIALKDLSTGGAAGASKMTAKEQAKAVLDKLPTFISENIEKFGIWFSDVAMDAITNFMEFASENLSKLPEFLGETLTNGLITFGTFIGDSIDKLDDIIEEKGGLKVVLKDILTSIGKVFKDKVWPALVAVFKTVVPIIGNIIKTIFWDIPVGFGKGIWKALDGAFDIEKNVLEFKDTLVEKWNVIVDKLKNGPLSFLSKIGDFFGKFKWWDDEPAVESTESINKNRGRRNRKSNIPEETVMANAEKQYKKEVEKTNAERIKELKRGNDNMAKTSDMEDMTDQIVGAIQENSSVNAQASSFIASTVSSSAGGGAVSNTTYNVTSNPVGNHREHGRRRASR